MIQSDLDQRIQRKKSGQWNFYNKRAASRYFEEGDKVGPRIAWIPGIMQSLTDPLSYLIELQDGSVVWRHVDVPLLFNQYFADFADNTCY